MHDAIIDLPKPISVSDRPTTGVQPASPGSTLTEVLSCVVRDHADRPAVWARGETRTFGELWDQAGAMAAALLHAGVAPRDRVAILCNRTVTVYGSILAAIRAACTYVPLNARFPLNRNRAMLAASGATALIIDAKCAKQFAALIEEPPPGLKVVLMPEPGTTVPETPINCLAAGDVRTVSPRSALPLPAPDDNLYLLFTSGSTGAPKGVPITHANVMAYLKGISQVTPVTANDRLIQLVDLTFDLSAHDMFLSWTNGASIVSVPENSTLIAPRFVQEQEVTGWLSVPSAIGLARQAGTLEPNSLASLRFSHFCGEALPGLMAEAWAAAAPNSLIYNIYGPTEATIAFSYYHYRPGHAEPPKVVPIGRPLSDQRIGLFNDEQKPVSAGEVGHIHLAGSQLTRGYWQAPHLDEEKFVMIDGVRWYRTGDLGRWTDTDGYHYAGRVDHQVKIRGYRVELLEIEAVLRRVSGRDLVAVVPWPLTSGGSADGVVAFVVGAPFAAAPVRDAVRAELPDYMVPSEFLFIDELPLNSNGKVDYKALAAGLAASSS